MKNIKYILGLAALLGVFASCEDPDTFPIPDFESGGLVRATVPQQNSFFDLADIENAKVVFSNLTPTDKEGGRLVAQYDIYATYTDVSEGEEYGPELMETVTTFPSTVEVTAQELSQKLGFPMSLFDGGDQILFTMVVTMTDGRTFSMDNSTAAINDEPNSRGTFYYNSYVGCSYVEDEIAGTYELVRDDWELATIGHSEVEVVAGPGENQFTIRNPYGHTQTAGGTDTWDIIVDVVDPFAGTLAQTRQESWRPVYWSAGWSVYGRGYTTGATGVVFTCTGTIQLTNIISVDAGTFGGRHVVEFKKVE